MSDIDAPVLAGKSRENVLITEGNWRIERFTYHIGYYYSIAHYCTAGRSGKMTKAWVGMFYQIRSTPEPCYVCSDVPPDGIQGAFTMLCWSNP